MKEIFDQIRVKSNSKLSTQKLSAALLAAVEETIHVKQKQKGKGKNDSSLPGNKNDVIAKNDVILAYYASFLILLQQQLSQQKVLENESEELVAILQLFSLLFPHLPSALLKEQSTEISNCFSEIIQRFSAVTSTSDSPATSTSAIVRYVLICMQHYISAQDVLAWNGADMPRLMHDLMLARLLDERPKVRKQACLSLIYLLERPPSPMLFHPACGQFVKFVQNILVSQEKSSESAAATVVHLLGCVKSVWPFMSEKSAQQLITVLFKYHHHGGGGHKDHGEHVSVALFSAIASYFQLVPASPTAAADGYSASAAVVAKKHLSQFLDSQPATATQNSSPALLVNWCLTLLALMRCLTSQDLQSCFGKVYVQIFNLLKQTPLKKEAVVVFREALSTTLSELNALISFEMVSEALTSSSSTQPGSSVLEGVISTAGKGLLLSYQANWALVLNNLASLITQLSSFSADPAATPLSLMKNVLEVLGDDATYAQNPNFARSHDMPAFLNVMGEAVKSMGPRRFMEMFPLNINPELMGYDARYGGRGWLLPLLKETLPFARNVELAYFLTDLVPLAAWLSTKSQQLTGDGQEEEGMKCALLWMQIWSLLPSFCHDPIDLQTHFEPVCKLIIPLLMSEEGERFGMICEALKLFAAGKKGDQESKTVFLQSYAKHIFPPLFSKYVSLSAASTDKDSSSLGSGSGVAKSRQRDKNAVLEVIKAWLGISDGQTLNVFFENTLRKYLNLSTTTQEEGNENVETKVALLDLANLLLGSMRLEVGGVEVLLGVVLGLLGEGNQNGDGSAVTNGALQKKAYKALNLFYEYASFSVPEGAESDAELAGRVLTLHEKFLKNQEFVSSLLSKLLSAQYSTLPASKKQRFTLLKNALCMLHWKVPGHLEYVVGIVGECVLGLKEVNEGARTAAFELLLALDKTCARIQKESGGEAFFSVASFGGDDVAADVDMEGKEAEKYQVSSGEFFKMVIAGLAGTTPHMISATIYAISRLLYEHRPSQPNLPKEQRMERGLVEDVVQTVLIYAEETKNREIIKAALGFIKVVVVTFSHLLDLGVTQQSRVSGSNATPLVSAMELGDSVQFCYLKVILRVVVKWSAEHGTHFKMGCRYLVERLVRKCGYDRVARFFPEAHFKLLSNIRKVKEREKGRKLQREQKDGVDGVEAEDGSFEQLMNDADVDDSLPQMFQDMIRTPRNTGATQGFTRAPLLVESEDPLDLMDHKMVSNLRSNKPATTATGKKKKVSFEEKEGKLVIPDSDSDSKDEGGEEEMMSGLARRASDAQNHYLQSLNSKDSFTRTEGNKIKFSNKRKSQDDDQDNDDELASTKKSDGGVGFGGKNGNKRRATDREFAKAGIKHSGKEYRSDKARGDVKKEGKPDPFAYIPLNPKIIASKNGKKKGVVLNKKLLQV